MGVQGYDYVTAFGETSALVNTWDKTLMFNQFKAVASEFYNKGIQVTNAPTTQPLGRSPWGGRLVEALGQDSYLNGVAFGLGTKAFSETGIIPGGKHFLLNEQETNRQSGMSSNSTIAPYSSVADDKTTHETYLWSWYDGAKNGMGGVMCAMTKVNDTLSCENEDLLQKFLKTQLGFPGMVCRRPFHKQNEYLRLILEWHRSSQMSTVNRQLSARLSEVSIMDHLESGLTQLS